MPVTAAIKFTQGVTTAPAGQAMFGVLSTPLVVSNGDDTNVASWTYELLDRRTGSAVPLGVLQDAGINPTYTITPDVRGGYLWHLTVKGFDGSVAEDTREFGIKEANGFYIPSYKAGGRALNFGGQARGWAPYMEEWLLFLQSLAGTLPVKPAVRVATTVALAASTIVGNVRTANANGALPSIDGVSPGVGDGVLDQHSGAATGIWTVTSLGSGGTPWVMTRRSDADLATELPRGTVVPVQEGTRYGRRLLVHDTVGAFTLGVTTLVFKQPANDLVGDSASARVTNAVVDWDGTGDGKGGTLSVEGRATTNDAVTWVTILTVTGMPDESVHDVFARVTALDATNGKAYRAVAEHTFIRHSGGGPAAVGGGSTVLGRPVADAALSTCSAQWVASGNNLLLQVKGVAATTLGWRAEMIDLRNVA